MQLFFLLASTITILLLGLLLLSILHRYRLEQLAGEQRLLIAQVETQELTLQEVAGEIHDNVNLSLVLAKLSLNTLNPDRKTEVLEKQETAVRLIGQAIDKLRDMSRGINTHLVTDQGLVRALEEEVARLRKNGRYLVHFAISGEPVFLDGRQDLALLRMAQEALNNIIRHAQATRVDISLAFGDRELTLCITDNGRGLEADYARLRSGSGRLNMKKRAGLLGGHCRIEGLPGGGTAVTITIPYNYG